jgi:vacuolar-type H+-ATPase subunit H
VTEPSEGPQGGTGSAPSLKRIKLAEQEAEGRLKKLRSEGEVLLKDLLHQAEAAVEAAKTEGNAARERALAEGRAHAEAEAAALLAEGKKVAEMIESKVTKTLNAKRDGVLTVIVGEFRGKGGN